MNKTTVALSKRQYKEIIKTMREGETSFRPNVRIVTALVIEANLGLRIEGILSKKRRKGGLKFSNMESGKSERR